MAPPVVVIVIASVATSAAVAYAVKEAWEPHIKPELQKARQAARGWWNKRQRRRSPVRAPPNGSPGPDDAGERRPRSPETPDERRPGPSRLESFVNSAMQLPSEQHPGGFLRQRSAANRQGAATPNETVEMSEIDKANPWIYHPPLSPAMSSLPGTARNSMVSDTTEGDPFDDLNRMSYMNANPSLPPLDEGLQLSFAPPDITSTTRTPTLYHPSSQSTLTPGLSSGSRSSNSTAGPTSATSLAPSPVQAHDRSGLTALSSPASAFSWADASSPASGRRSVIPSYDAAHPDDFVHLHNVDADSEAAFSIGSYDDLTTTVSSSSSAHGQTSRDRSDAGSAVDDDDDEPMSPPHNSEQGSPKGSSSSNSDWESVGSPASSAGHRRLV